MSEYKIILDENMEKFLDLYLLLFPLRSEHKREDYPGLIVINFINSMMKRRNEFLGIYKDRYSKEYSEEVIKDGSSNHVD